MTILLIFLLAVQTVYWYSFSKLGQNASLTAHSDPLPASSVVICARNAAHQLEANLHKVLDQRHPEFEVIVCDHDSDDDTGTVLERMDSEKRHLSVHKVTKNRPGKREALWKGIDNSRHPIVIMTDADCAPVSSVWLGQMSAPFIKSETHIVLGYSPILPGQHRSGYWAHFEGWMTGVQYLSYAMHGLPYMGVGRNVAYRREILSESVLNRHGDLASGDDDLTVMQLATKSNTALCLAPETFVTTPAASSWSSYVRQKRRHYSTAPHYKPLTKALLGAFSMTQILFYLGLVLLVASGSVLQAILLYALRQLLLLYPVHKLMGTLQAQFKLHHFPLLDAGLALHYLLFSLAVLFPQKSSW